jgi:hypothetical protein
MSEKDGKALACGHEGTPFGSPICAHLRECTKPWLSYVKWYTGAGLKWAREINAFAGPAGAFFSDGTWLFSSDETGLSRWDLVTGERTGHLPGFHPSQHHRSARELIELRDGLLVRMSI